MADFSLSGLSALLKGKIGEGRYSRQIAAALALAYRGHDGQLREQVDRRAPPIPYIVHPVGVAILATELFLEVDLTDEFDDVISACLTHDLLEDTDVSPYELEEATSKRTLEIVAALSKPEVHGFRSREDRNAAFLNAIRAAGRTAVFIKICDSLHNLSRPEQTPLGLLRKTAAKARHQYAELIVSEGLGEHLLNRYKKNLNEIDAMLVQSRDVARAEAGYEDLDTALRYCRQRTKRKILEPHDVIDVLKETTGAREVLYGSVSEILSRLNIPINGGRDAENLTQLLAVDGADLAAGELPDVARTRIASANRVLIAAPKGLRADHIFLLLLSPTPPAWVSGPVVSLLVSFLVERSALRDATKLVEMAEAISNNGMNLNPHLAIAAGIKILELPALARHLSAAVALKSYLDGILLKPFAQNMEMRVERRESRIKDANSISRKSITKKIPIMAIDDLIGYRIIVRNLTDRQKVANYIADKIQSCGLEIKRSPELKTISTPLGYSADHLSWAVVDKDAINGELPVEVQIRTILGDAWARISQIIEYKKSNTIVKKNERILKKLRDMISEVEQELVAR